MLVREAAQVANNSVVIKDHLLEGMFAAPTLRFMDWLGNRGRDELYFRTTICPRSKWDEIFSGARLQVNSRRPRSSGSILIQLRGCSIGGCIL